MFNRVQVKSYLQGEMSFLIPDKQIHTMPVELRELCEQYNSDCKDIDENHVAAHSEWPVSLFVPERYEERYPYPLVIWFHDDNSSENELDVVMNAIGNQNYCGLALRGNHVLEGHDSFAWNTNALEFGKVPLKQLVNVTTRRLRRAFHIHSERIFVAGAGAGADVALRLFAECPEWFAGAVLIDPGCEERPALGNGADLRGKHVLQVVSRTASNETLAGNVDSVRLLRSAGVEVDVRVTEESLDPCSNNARFIDSWILSRMNCETYV